MRGKTINGIKRHIIVDTLGLLLAVVVASASIQDRDGAKLVFERIRKVFPRLKLFWYGWILQVAKRIVNLVPNTKAFPTMKIVAYRTFWRKVVRKVASATPAYQ